MRPLRDDDPPGTRVVVTDYGPGSPYRVAVLDEVTPVFIVRLRTPAGSARWNERSDACRVLEEGDEP